jgi:hypothetical protein
MIPRLRQKTSTGSTTTMSPSTSHGTCRSRGR